MIAPGTHEEAEPTPNAVPEAVPDEASAKLTTVNPSMAALVSAETGVVVDPSTGRGDGATGR